MHSSINGYLGCRRIVATVSNAAMNCEHSVHVSFQIASSFSLDKYPEMELLGHMVALF